MGDIYQRFTTGQKFTGPPTRLQNAQLDLARAGAANTLLGANPSGDGLPDGLVFIENSSGSDVDECNVLGLSGVMFTDQDNLSEFKYRPTLTGVTPTAAHAGKFCVTLEPIANQKIGRAFILGLCTAQVKMNSTSDPCADVLPGDATQLQSGGTGAVQIIFCGQPITDGSSTHWCTVKFQAGVITPEVRPTATQTGRGWYGGFVCPGGANGTLGSNALNPSQDLTPAMFNAAWTGGSIPSGTTCYIMNVREAWGTTSGTHSLDINSDGSGTLYPRSFPAIYIGQSTDSTNTPCYLIDGVQDGVFCATT